MRGEAREEEGTAGLKQRPEADDLVAHGAVRAQAEQPRAQYAGARGPRRVEARLVDLAEQLQAERLQHCAHDLCQEREHRAQQTEGHRAGVMPELDAPRRCERDEEGVGFRDARAQQHLRRHPRARIEEGLRVDALEHERAEAAREAHEEPELYVLESQPRVWKLARWWARLLLARHVVGQWAALADAEGIDPPSARGAHVRRQRGSGGIPPPQREDRYLDGGDRNGGGE